MSLIRGLASALALVLTAGQGMALSCAPVDPATTYQLASDAPERYAILRGRLEFDQRRLPPEEGYFEDPSQRLAPVPARIVGRQMHADGSFGAAGFFPLTLETGCVGPWCGGATAGADVLAFVRVAEDSSLHLDLHPCGLWHFTEPEDWVYEAVSACVRGEACEPKS